MRKGAAGCSDFCADRRRTVLQECERLIWRVRESGEITCHFCRTAVAASVLSPGRMGEPVRKHQDLIAWQLCNSLRALVLRYTRTGPASTDYDYRRQLRKAARSACYNTSEGFYRYNHGEFGHHLNIARASLGEALDQIDEGLEQKYFTPEQNTDMRRICIRAMKAITALRRSWAGRAAPRPKTSASGVAKTPKDAKR